MPSLLPHDLCHGRSSSLAPSSDRIPVELFQILKDNAVESAALNMQYAGSRQGNVADFILGGFKITADGAVMKLKKTLTPWKEIYDLLLVTVVSQPGHLFLQG